MDLFEYAQKLKEESAKATTAAPQESVYTVSEITTEIKDLIANRFPDKVWIKGEVSNYRGRNQSGHMYFRLKDAGAVIGCVFFRGSNAKLKFELKDGMEVIAHGRLDLWDKGGNYQLIVDELRSGGVGELYLKFEMLKKKLEAEGLFAVERKRPLPAFPARIGVVTSATGAVVRDIIHVVRARCPHVAVVLHPVKVQGDGAREEIARAIADLNAEEFALDLLIVGRGGGSIEDLWAFNEEVVARAIHASRVPVISAVGHQTDFTIADFVADVRAATPSHAAEMSVPNLADLGGKVAMLMRAIVRELAHFRELARQKLRRLAASPGLRDPRHAIALRTQRVDDLTERLAAALRQKRTDRQARVARAGLVLRMLLGGTLAPRRAAFTRAASNLALLNPLSILARGYSVVRSKEGKVVKRAGEVGPGDALDIGLFEGEISCTVTKTSKA